MKFTAVLAVDKLQCNCKQCWILYCPQPYITDRRRIKKKWNMALSNNQITRYLKRAYSKRLISGARVNNASGSTVIAYDTIKQNKGLRSIMYSAACSFTQCYRGVIPYRIHWYQREKFRFRYRELSGKRAR